MEGDTVSRSENVLTGYQRSPAPEGPLDGRGREIGLLGGHVHGGDPGEPVPLRLLSVYDASVQRPGFLSAHWRRKTRG